MKTGRAVQAIGKGGALQGLARFGIEIEIDQLVEVGGGRGRFRIARPDGDPEPALGVKVHLHRIDEFRESGFGGDEFQRAALGHGNVLHGFLTTQVGHGILPVRRGEIHRRQVVVLDLIVPALGRCPHRAVAVGREDIPLRQFLSEDGGVVDAFIFDAGPSAKNVVLIHRAVAVVPLGVFLHHGGPDLFQSGFLQVRGSLAEQGFKLHRSQRPVPGFREVNPIEGQPLRGFCIKIEGGMIQVHERHLVRIGHFGHDFGVDLQVQVGLHPIREVRVLQVFMGDRGKQHHAGRGLFPIASGGFFQIGLQILPEVIGPGGSFEGLIESPVCKNDRGIEVGPGFVDHLGVPDFNHRVALLHIEEVFGLRHLIGARVQIHLVRGKAQIAHRQFQIRIGPVDHGFQVTMVLLAVREATAHDGDLVALFKFQPARLVGGIQRSRDGKNANNRQISNDHGKG